MLKLCYQPSAKFAVKIKDLSLAHLENLVTREEARGHLIYGSASRLCSIFKTLGQGLEFS